MDLLKLASNLCSNLTGSKCAVPRESAWRITMPGQANISLDVADVMTGGLAAVLPANAKVYGSYFVCGLERSVGPGMKATVTGFGGGVGLGAGWGTPFIGASSKGKQEVVSLKRRVFEKVGSSVQGYAIDQAKGPGSWGGGTRLVTGPDTAGDLVLDDFHNAYATVVGLSANAVINGVSGGLVIFSKQKPVLTPVDLPYAKAFGLIAGVGLAMSLDVEANSLYYNLRVASGVCI